MHVRALEDRGWFVVLDVGEEIVASLHRVALDHGVTGAQVAGLGAVCEAELAFFDPATNLYQRATFDEPMEIGNLVGNLGVADGQPRLHAHVTLGRRDFSAVTGHLVRGVIGVTGEFALLALPGGLARTRSDRFALDLLDLGARPGGER